MSGTKIATGELMKEQKPEPRQVLREAPCYEHGTVFFYAGSTKMEEGIFDTFCGTWTVDGDDKTPHDVWQDIIDNKREELGKDVCLTAMNLLSA